MNKTVAVIFGGRSAEHDISIVTAIAAVVKPLELTKKFNVVPIYISKDGKWFSDEQMKDVTFFSSGKIEGYLAVAKPLQLLFDSGLVLIKPGLRSVRIPVDVAFPAMHGTYGEDGSLMGVLRMANVPFVGCDLAASAVAMDKVLAKAVAKANDIPIAKHVAFTKYQFQQDAEAIIKHVSSELTFPVFVKPAHLGSSIGITRVKDAKELANAIEVALHYDDKALVEEGVQNLVEVTVPMMGNDTVTPALVEQPMTHAEDFFDFETKYMHGGGKKGGSKNGQQAGAQGYSKLPADIPKPLYEKSLQVAKDVYVAVGCKGLARVDLLIDSKTDEVYFNEINPLPGSLYMHNWQQAGIAPIDLVTKLVTLAEEAFERRTDQDVVFSTNFLKQF